MQPVYARASGSGGAGRAANQQVGHRNSREEKHRAQRARRKGPGAQKTGAAQQSRIHNVTHHAFCVTHWDVGGRGERNKAAPCFNAINEPHTSAFAAGDALAPQQRFKLTHQVDGTNSRGAAALTSTQALELKRLGR